MVTDRRALKLFCKTIRMAATDVERSVDFESIKQTRRYIFSTRVHTTALSAFIDIIT